MTRKMIWNLARCVFTLVLVFAFTTAIVGCAEQNKGPCCQQSKECPKTCPMTKDAAAAQPAQPAPAPAPAEKPAGRP